MSTSEHRSETTFSECICYDDHIVSAPSPLPHSPPPSEAPSPLPHSPPPPPRPPPPLPSECTGWASGSAR
ncbi:unnamed protein product, partial [Lampetra planeri]